ncbi:hypothetical protein AB1Y20_023399 [Prymnesium parvum]|uniref:DCD domain-containing protein n=1 Tax=Prymnesium parvum TaxID=97485 RepID=A0AB34JG99_PRYPA
MANAWEAATRSSYSMSYGLPHQQQMLTPQLHQQPQITDGLIFLCDPQTEEECLQRGLFGTPASQAPLVRQVAPEATLLFLFNVSCFPGVAPNHEASSDAVTSPRWLCGWHLMRYAPSRVGSHASNEWHFPCHELAAARS